MGVHQVLLSTSVVFKILHNNSFNSKHVLLTIEIQMKICDPTLCLSNCQEGYDKTDTLMHCWWDGRARV